MTRRAIATLAPAALLAAACLTPATHAATDFTLTAGSVSFTQRNLTSPSTGTSNGHADFKLGSDATDNMFQNWFWMRAGTDTRELALSNQIFSTVSNRALLVYEEPANNGAVPGAVSVELEYTLHDLSSSPGKADEALLTIAWKIRNLTNNNLNVLLFHYADFDAAGSATGDSAVELPGASTGQQIADSGASSVLPVRIDYVCSGTNHLQHQAAAFPAIRNLLTDSGASTLSNAGLPLNSADYTGAHAWGVNLSVAGYTPSFYDGLTGSVTIHLTARCKADHNENGSLGVNDIFAYLTDWFAGCP